MNIKLKELIKELNLSITAEDILAYLDGSNLKIKNSSKIKKIIKDNLELKKFVNEFLNISESPIISNPPKIIHQNLISKLGFSEENIIDICLKIFDYGLDIISGNQLINQNQFVPTFRNQSKNKLKFNKNFKKINFKGFLQKLNKHELKIYFKIISINEQPIKNYRVEIEKNQELIKSLVTDEFGITQSVNLINGYYKFTITKNNNIDFFSLRLI